MKTVIFHADDLGMCHAANTAFEAIADYGITQCGSVMVPCPWFAETARMARENHGWDIGVHLTLTSEWRDFRWGPISTRDPGSGLIDSQGCFWRTSAELQAHVDPHAAAKEMRAQIDRALEAGIDMTHIDTHMGTAFSPPIFEAYLALAQEYSVPAFITPIKASAWPMQHVQAAQLERMRGAVEQIVHDGWPLFNEVGYESLNEPQDRVGQYARGIANLKDGLTHYLYHPSTASAELSAAAPDHAAREGDLAAFTSPSIRTAIAHAGVRNIGYRELRTQLRESLSASNTKP